MRRGQTDGQSVPEVSGGLHHRGNVRRRHDIPVGEHQQVHGAHTGTQTQEKKHVAVKFQTYKDSKKIKK